MNAQRLAAVVATIALIAGALAIRRAIDDDDETSDPGSTTEPAGEPTGAVVCITELEAVCDALANDVPGLEVSTEPALDTVDQLAALEDPADAPTWITVEPFPAMVDVLRTNAGDDELGWTNEAVGATQLAIAVRAGRLAALEAACADRTTWRCIGDAKSFADLGGDGDVGVGFGDADRSAAALAGVAAATAGYFERTDIVQSDFDAEPGFRVWFRGLATSTSLTSLSGGSPLATMLTRPAVTVASTYDAQVAALPAAATRVEVNYPRPAMWLLAVVATPGGSAAPGDLVGRTSTTLEGAGWEPPAVAADASLLRPSTMLALRTLWQEAV